MPKQHYYQLIGNRAQFYQENIREDNFTVNSRVFYKRGVFSDFRGVMVGNVRLPSQFAMVAIALQTPTSTPQFTTVRGSSADMTRMPSQPPYPFEIAIRDPNSDSGWSFWQLRFGEVPTLSTRNQNPPSTNIRMLGDSGIGLDPASNLGIYSKVGGWGWNPLHYEYRYQPVFSFPGFEEQRSENPAQAASHPGYNNFQAFIPSSLVNQRMRGIITDTPAKVVAANIASENVIAYYGNAPGQIPSSPAGSVPTAFPSDTL